ncbi:phosphoglucomutase/phosphomannomutase alpha/beta/alpha domain I [Colwellia psychrerythraea]|uniref:Phosphoglucomutase/phosphomannomutase alpha/beta/alpha domain I n=1 Tax=Colwellia psychrerythraea TaxID=28229 RepID=A0A099L2M5_COLPS|nr:phosphoglucomutase/phosphomannomutase alpha/beta/alpha domain I [Colwellia psychrerythraea]
MPGLSLYLLPMVLILLYKVTHYQAGVLRQRRYFSLIICHNKSDAKNIADGLVITPSHNPPSDGGIKYNSPHGDPAEGDITKQIEQRANELIAANPVAIKQLSYQQALQSPLLIKEDFISHYVDQLDQVIDMQAIAKAGVSIGVDPLGGSGIDYWPVIAQHMTLR